MIEDKFPQISQEYDALNSHDISIPPFTEKSIPHITQSEVKMTLSKIKIKVYSVPGDIPACTVNNFQHP